MHLPRDKKLKTPAWAVNEAWLCALWTNEREYEQEWMTDVSADDEASGNEGSDHGFSQTE